jgi:hypothetical protein
MFVLPMYSYFMSLERTRGRYGSRGWRSRSPELRREHSMVMEHSSHLSHDAYMTRHAIHVFSLRRFVCTVCVNIEKNNCESRNSELLGSFF